MRHLALTALVIVLGALGMAAQSPDGNDILDQTSQTSVISAQGSRVSRIEFNITDRNDFTVPRAFAFFSKRVEGEPNRLLVFFLEPELERGTIFLSVDPQTPDEGAKIWLFLPALGQAKELISDSDRDAGFAGSNLTNEQLANGFDFSGDYDGDLLGEEALEVAWLGERRVRNAYKIALTARPQSQVDFPTGLVWIDTEAFVVLRAELNTEAGELQQVTELDDFVTFKEQVEPNVITVSDVISGSQTEIRFVGRIEVDTLPDEIFDVESLPEFDPTDFGVEG